MTSNDFACTASSFAIPGSHRYQLTPFGMTAALFFTRAHNRFIRTGLADLLDTGPPTPPPIRRAFDRVDAAINDLADHAGMAAAA